MQDSLRICITITKKTFLLVLGVLLLGKSLFSQINPTNTCVTPGSTYSYSLQSGSYSYTSPMTTMVWSVTNGIITSSSSGTLIVTINVQWNAGITTGQVRVTTTNPSASWTLNVSASSGPLIPGTITSANPPSPVPYNTAISVPISFTAPSGGGCGTSVYTYDWQQSTDNVNFTSMGVATPAITLTAPLLQNTYYRRRVLESTSGTNAFTASVPVTVITQPGSISPGALTINANTSPGQLTGTIPLGGTGTYTYQWYQSTNAGTIWSPVVSNGTSKDFFSPVLTATTWYRRAVTSVSPIVYSNISVITVSAAPIMGVVPATNSAGNINIDMLWVKATGYDPSGNIIGQGKTFYDNAGKLLQTQAKVFYRKDPTTVYTHVMASQPIYDAYGRATASTLAAPIDNAEFSYKSDFVTAVDGSKYTYKNFDLYNPTGTQTDKTNNPDPVGGQATVGTLGWYFSSNNTWEPYTPETAYPYSRAVYYRDGTENVKKEGSTGEAFKMGSNHEASNFITPVSGELAHYITVRNKYFPEAGNLPLNLQGKAIQSVSRDANGNEAIVVSDISGKPLLTGRPGSEWTANNSVSIATIPLSFSQEVSCVTGANVSIQSFTGGTNVNMYLVNSSGVISLAYSGLVTSIPLNVSFGTGKLIIVANAPFSMNYTSGGVAYSSGSATNVGGSIQSIGYFKILADNTPVTITGVYTLYDMSTEVVTSLTAGKLNRGYYKIAGAGVGIVNVSYTNSFADVSYNFYNQLGQLIATIAPEGVKKLYNTGINSYAVKTAVPFINLYNYNVKGQLISSSSPDGGTTKFVYRTDGMLRFSQNAKQAAAGAFSYTNFDQYGQPVESGEYIGTIGFTNDLSVGSAMKTILDDVTINGGLTGGTQTDVVRTKYSIVDNSHGLAGYLQDPYNIRGGVSMTEKYSKVTNNVAVAADLISRNWYNYDEEGKVVWQIKYINGPGFGYKTIDFTYDNLGHVTKKVFQKNTATETFVHYYEYDPANQNLSKIYTNTVDNNLTKMLQATYTYYLHGGIKRVELANKLQGIDYTYTLQGALKAINNSNKTADPGGDGPGNGVAADAYGMVLDYFTGDYVNTRTAPVQSIKGVNTTSIISNESYGGNIKAMTWYSDKPAFPAGLSNLPLTYVYKYDSKYQFTESVWGTGVNFGTSPASFTTTAFNKESIYLPGTSTPAYDANGNILNLQRTNGTGVQTDKFAYTYLANSNKLSTVINTAGTTQTYGSYTYDALGQMVAETTTDPANQQKFLKYDVSGKVTLVARDAAFTQKVVEFVYDETGQRIMKKNYNATFQLLQVTYYTGNAIYTQAVTGGTSYGAAIAQEYVLEGAGSKLGIFYRQAPVYAYQLTDHLGNVRAVVAASGTSAVVRAYTDYYPYGITITPAVATDYRYGYQGNYAEKDGETNWNAFELRMYDSRIARWLQYDPANQHFSPYVGMGNDPVNRTDPNGGWDWVEKDGKMVYDSRVTTQALATELYGDGAVWRENGYSYTASNGACIELGDHGFFKSNGQIFNSHDFAQDALQLIQNQMSALNLLLVTVRGVRTFQAADVATPEPTDLMPWKWVGHAVVFAATYYLIDKYSKELAELVRKTSGRRGVQYALIATTPGLYPVMSSGSSIPTGTQFLYTGDVWKYGETINPASRYSETFKNGLGVEQVDEFYGNQIEIKIAEKTQIYAYFLEHGQLPPGNKIFR